jgi:hypothetical protein
MAGTNRGATMVPMAAAWSDDDHIDDIARQSDML